MKGYSYTAKDFSGKTVQGFFQAEDPADLLRKISESSLFCLTYAETKSTDVGPKYRFPLKALTILCRQLSIMLSSGMTLVKSLSMLHEEQRNARARQSLLELYEKVQTGHLLSEAMRDQNGAFPEFFVSMVAAGESSGMLDIVMKRMAEHYEKENRLSNKIKTAMAYPAILLVMSLAVVIGLFTFIMPAFMQMFEGAEVPPLTRVMLAVSDFIRTGWMYILIGIGLLALILYFANKLPAVKVFAGRIKMRAPSFGKLMTKVYISRFARTMSSLYSSGIPMIQCLEKSVDVLGNAFITRTFEGIIEEVQRGESLSSSMSRAEIFEPMFCSIIYVGEESGSLDEILSSISNFYEEEADTAVQQMVALIEPIMIIFLGLIIGLVIASILPTVYSMYGNIA